MSRALVLNATYEPIGVVSGRRAAILALAQKVDVLEESGQRLVSTRIELPVPSVVRLRYYVRVPYERTAPLSRRSVFARDEGTCQYCGRPAESIDHVIPRSKGGTHEWHNVVACCRSCNSSKADRLLHDTSLRLRTTPIAPTRHIWIRVSANPIPSSWDPYLDRSSD